MSTTARTGELTEFRGLLLGASEPLSITAATAAKDPTYRQLWLRATEALCCFFDGAEVLLGRSRCALELGSGLGAAGMWAALKGCSYVTLSDYHALALHQLRANVARNGLSSTLSNLDPSCACGDDQAAMRRRKALDRLAGRRYDLDEVRPECRVAELDWAAPQAFVSDVCSEGLVSARGPWTEGWPLIFGAELAVSEQNAARLAKTVRTRNHL